MGTFKCSKLKAKRATRHGRLGCQRHCGGLGWEYVHAVICGPTFEPRGWVVSQDVYDNRLQRYTVLVDFVAGHTQGAVLSRDERLLQNSDIVYTLKTSST